MKSTKKHYQFQHKNIAFYPPDKITYTIFSDSIWSKFINLLHKKDRIVDFGCGGGSVLYCLEKKGFTNLYGIDFCDGIPKGFLARTKFSLQDVTKTNFKSGFFNGLISTMVIEHTNDLKFESEVARVLKKGGIALITSVMKSNYSWYFYRNKNGETVIEPTHVKEYLSKNEYCNIFIKNFTIIDCQIKQLQYPFIDPIFRILHRITKIDLFKELPTKNKFFSKLRNMRIPIIGYYSIEILLKRK